MYSSCDIAISLCIYIYIYIYIYYYYYFQQNWVKTQVVTVLTCLFANSRKLHKLATTKNIFGKSTLSDMHDRRTYMHINFQQNRVNILVKTVHTNLFAQYRKLHKFATINSNFEKKKNLLHMHHHKTSIYINFSQNHVETQVMTCSQVYSQKSQVV